MRNHSNNLDYLATIKKNHKIEDQFSFNKGVESISRTWPYVRALSDAQRLNGMKTIRPYTTASHCYYTAILFQEIALREAIPIHNNEIRFVLQHDVFETITGDVLLPVKIHSANTKRKWEEIETEIAEAYPDLVGFTDEDAKATFSVSSWNLFKACDLLELYIFCKDEITLGNRSSGILAVLQNCRKLLPEFDIRTISRYVDGS